MDGQTDGRTGGRINEQARHGSFKLLAIVSRQSLQLRSVNQLAAGNAGAAAVAEAAVRKPNSNSKCYRDQFCHISSSSSYGLDGTIIGRDTWLYMLARLFMFVCLFICKLDLCLSSSQRNKDIWLG